MNRFLPTLHLTKISYEAINDSKQGPSEAPSGPEMDLNETIFDDFDDFSSSLATSPILIKVEQTDGEEEAAYPDPMELPSTSSEVDESKSGPSSTEDKVDPELDSFFNFNPAEPEQKQRMAWKGKYKMTPSGKTSCLACSKVYTTSSAFQKHYVSSHLNRRWTCIPCGKSFTMASAYRYHLSVAHEEQAKLECEKCHKVLSKAGYAHHKRWSICATGAAKKPGGRPSKTKLKAKKA